MIERSVLTLNGTAVTTTDTSQIHLSDTALTFNAVAVKAEHLGGIYTRGNNTLRGNTSDGAFTGTFAAQ